VALLKYVTDKSLTDFEMHTLIAGNDSRGILPPVLELEKTVVEFTGDRFACKNPDDSAHQFCSSSDGIRLRILTAARAALPGSRTVITGVLLGIWRVEWILTSISTLSANGGQAMTGKLQFAATKPDSAFERPAMVI